LFQYEQPVADLDVLPVGAGGASIVPPGGMPIEQPAKPASTDGERAARASLRAQITKLENELSGIVAERFPFISARSAGGHAGGPRLPDLAELERSRDRLAGRLQELHAVAARRTEHELRARQLLEAMKLEPGRYKYYRVPVRDLGEGGCGVWEVRPRLGLIGMLAGWWQLTLSSGCPLPMGSRPRRGPARVS
jgi:hypothetical protein